MIGLVLPRRAASDIAVAAVLRPLAVLLNYGDGGSEHARSSGDSGSGGEGAAACSGCVLVYSRIKNFVSLLFTVNPS
jgi:hypothetical protein